MQSLTQGDLVGNWEEILLGFMLSHEKINL